MVDLRCNKCGSSEGFLIETQDGKELPIKGRLNVDRILKTVHVTCTYCNNDWSHVPIRLVDKDPIRVTP
ncbi:MAG: hypothetical protein ACPHK8_07285 [Thermoplasmatota archaeon]